MASSLSRVGAALPRARPRAALRCSGKTSPAERPPLPTHSPPIPNPEVPDACTERRKAPQRRACRPIQRRPAPARLGTAIPQDESTTRRLPVSVAASLVEESQGTTQKGTQGDYRIDLISPWRRVCVVDVKTPTLLLWTEVSLLATAGRSACLHRRPTA
uniref:Uncharacterized protein n=1 Tax=Oryza rufipogon TaxID=4529 RepID=A0A0E0PAR6_ORYRU